MKKYFIFFAVTFLFFSCSAQDFTALSKLIEGKRQEKEVKWKGQTFNDIRIKLYDNKKIGFLVTNLNLMKLSRVNILVDFGVRKDFWSMNTIKESLNLMKVILLNTQLALCINGTPAK